MSKEVRNPPLPGYLDLRIQLGERLEGEAALVQARMGNSQPWLVYELVGVDEQIEVDRPWPPPCPVANAPELTLDAEKDVEELPRRKGRLDGSCPVEEARLVDHPDGIGLAQPRHGDDIGALRRTKKLDRSAERVLARAEIRAEADVRPWH
jgi:hypothetical protein